MFRLLLFSLPLLLFVTTVLSAPPIYDSSPYTTWNTSVKVPGKGSGSKVGKIAVPVDDDGDVIKMTR